ncbi:MAG TPA: ATP-binding protein [Pirellulaceae bacterium]|nr:ATP-binding protein [Pirellulaceae bacterium]
MNPGRFANLLAADESEDHEFLSSADKPEIAKTVCAFLNGMGGRIVVGADSTGALTPIANPDDAASQVEDYLRKNVLPVAAWSATIEKSDDDATILVIDVPVGMAKPYMIHGRIWCRRAGATVPAEPDDLSRMIQDRIHSDERWERRSALGIVDDDLDFDEVLRAAEEIEKGGRYQFAKPREPVLVLSELSLHVAGQYTNAAVVLFGKNPTAVFPQTAVRITLYETDKRGKEIPFDEVLDLNLFGTLGRLVEIVHSKVGVAAEFRHGDWQRDDQPVYPFWSLREGFINGLMHRDYSSPSGGMSVNVYPDRITIWNSGALPKDWKQSDLMKDHPSMPRNPDIAHVCFLRRYIDKLGRGTQLIVEECQRAGLRRPDWTSGPTGTTLTFVSKQKSKKSAQQALNQRQLAVLEKLSAGDRWTVAEYLDTLGEDAVSERTARTDLNRLVQAGLMVRRGSGKNTFYERTDRGL